MLNMQRGMQLVADDIAHHIKQHGKIGDLQKLGYTKGVIINFGGGRVFLNGRRLENANFIPTCVFDLSKPESVIESLLLADETKPNRRETRYGFELNCGLAAITGGAGTGKSVVTRLLSDEPDAARITIGEPAAQVAYSLQAFSVIFTEFVHMENKNKLYVDSARMLITEFSGQLTTGGLSREVGGFLTNLQRLCEHENKVLGIVLNPSTKKKEAIEEFTEILEGMANTLVKPAEVAGDYVEFSIYDRFGERRDMPFRIHTSGKAGPANVRPSLKDLL